MAKKTGKCWLVGAGPGDPGLLTLRGREALAQAEVVVFDNLVNRELLGLAPDTAELIYAGKKPGAHEMPQEEISKLLVTHTAAGRRVVRLKGGDPLVFARGAEEAEALAAARVPYEIVPGVSSALAGPAYAGIAVTRRGINKALLIFSGHEDPSIEEGRSYYAGLAAVAGTKVMLMGVERLRGIAAGLQAGGASPELPVAVIRRATMGDQVVLRGTLAGLADQVEAAGLRAPAVVVFGEVAAAGSALDWRRSVPLAGRRIVVTRSRMQASGLSARLRDLGADVYELPLIRREPPRDMREFAELVQDAHSYEWLVFTSANGVDAFFEIFDKLYDDAREIGGVKFAAVGSATAERLKRNRFHVDLVADDFTAESLVEKFRQETDVENVKILVVRPEETAGALAAELTKMDAIVDEAIAYRTVPETADRTSARKRLADEGADLVVFTSSSTVRSFVAQEILPKEQLRAASIGPVTSKTLGEHGIKPVIEATRHDLDGLVEAIVRHFAS
ncbi:MAG: uroporphyrinogen-III C-methyltransferase [Chthoniobacterales bacterium]